MLQQRRRKEEEKEGEGGQKNERLLNERQRNREQREPTVSLLYMHPISLFFGKFKVSDIFAPKELYRQMGLLAEPHLLRITCLIFQSKQNMKSLPKQSLGGKYVKTGKKYFYSKCKVLKIKRIKPPFFKIDISYLTANIQTIFRLQQRDNRNS